MFSSKPVQRTTDPAELRKKAMAFLDKHYTRLKPNEIKENIYMLEPNSINGMKKIFSSFRSKDVFDDNSLTLTMPVVEYKILKPNGEEDVKSQTLGSLTIPYDEPKWHRTFGFGNSAMDAVLGGRKSVRKSRRNRRRQRKTRR